MFQAKIERMRRIFRGEEFYGDGTPSEQATAYKFGEMFDEVVRRAQRNSASIGRPEVDLLVSLSGFSPATTILAFELLQPKRVFIMSSDGTDRSIDVIDDYLVRGNRLPARYFRHEPCDGTNPLSIYQQVKAQVAPERRAAARPASAIIDITGGKKVMSAAAALVAWKLNLRLCYVDSQYDPELRQPVPGTERLLIVDNPATLFREDEMEAALEAFRSGAFANAHERFARLAESVPDPGRARFLRDLAGLYQAYSDFDLDSLPAWIDRTRRSLEDPQSKVIGASADQVRHQLDYLKDLAGQGEFLRFLPNFLVLGRHYQDLRRLDFAALLYYRTAEGCFSERLKLGYSGFDCSHPDYGLLGMPKERLLEGFNTTRRKLGLTPAADLPYDLGFVNAAIMLHLLDDEMLRRVKITDVRGLNHLAKLTEARNHSLLAHGELRVTADQCDSLRGRVLSILRALWDLHGPGEDLDKVCEGLRFLKDV
jgi:CRISPR-associated protein (TIGR02710 family)